MQRIRPGETRSSEGTWVFRRRLSSFQGAFYVATGIWPFLHIQSFLAVTGPKTDLWLVQAFGLLVFALGAVFVLAPLRGPADEVVAWFGISTATALAFIDVYFVCQGYISQVYLLDGIVEIVIALAWAISLRRARRLPSSNIRHS